MSPSRRRAYRQRATILNTQEADEVEDSAGSSQDEGVGSDIDGEAVAFLNQATHNMEGRVTRSGRTTNSLSTKPQPPKATSSKRKRSTRSDDIHDIPTDGPSKRQTKRARHDARTKQSTTTPTNNDDGQSSVAVVIHQNENSPGNQPRRRQTRGAKQRSNNHRSGGDDDTRQTSHERALSDKRRGRGSRRDAPQPPTQTPDKINQQNTDIESEEEGPAGKGRSESTESARDSGIRSLSEEDEAEDEGSLVSDEEEQSSGSRTLINMILPEFLEGIIEVAERVGRKGKRGSTNYEVVLRDLELRTPLGKKMNQALRLLKSSYTELQEAKRSKTSATIRGKHARASLRIQHLIEAVDEITNLGFGSPRDWTETSRIDGVKSLLVDLYFNLLPMLLKCIKLGVETHDEDGRITVFILKDFDCLIDLYWGLAKSALKLPAGIQPVADDCIPRDQISSSFQIRQPTQKALKELHPHRKRIKEKLWSIERTEKDAERFRLQVEREEMMRERELAQQVSDRRRQLRQDEIQHQYHRQQEHQKQQRIKEIHRLQRQILDRYHASRKLGVGTYSPRRSAAPVFGGVMQGYHPYHHAQSQHEQFNESVDEDDSDPFADDYSPPRIRVFPNNNKKSNAPVVLSDRQRAMFIECMRLEEGNVKYQRAAEELQCSMDEVFTYAKDLQEAMDIAHEKGTMNSEEEEWTYDIWVERD